MSSKMKQNASIMMAMTAIAMSSNKNSMIFTGRDDDAWTISPLKYKFNFLIPKGTKLYLFKSNGSFESFTEFASRNEMPNYCVFHCVAINDKSAINKFTKFKNI